MKQMQNNKKKTNNKKKQGGFTLIELLAVITIMGILMMVAIPAVSRTIENSRRDTFANTAKAYVDAVKNAVSTDELQCNTTSATIDTLISATPTGTYYVNIATEDQTSPNEYISQQTKDLMESGGKSSWGSSDVKGYVAITKNTDSDNRTTYVYNILLVDKAGRGIKTITEGGETAIKRSAVNASTTTQNYNNASFQKASTSVRECKVNN